MGIPPNLYVRMSSEEDLIKDLKDLGYDNFYYDEEFSKLIKNMVTSYNIFMSLIQELNSYYKIDCFSDNYCKFTTEPFYYKRDMRKYIGTNKNYITLLHFNSFCTCFVVNEKYLEEIKKFIKLFIFN